MKGKVSIILQWLAVGLGLPAGLYFLAAAYWGFVGPGGRGPTPRLALLGIVSLGIALAIWVLGHKAGKRIAEARRSRNPWTVTMLAVGYAAFLLALVVLVTDNRDLYKPGHFALGLGEMAAAALLAIVLGYRVLAKRKHP